MRIAAGQSPTATRGKSSVDEDLIDSADQTRRALLILETDYDKRQLAKDINSYFKGIKYQSVAK